MRQYKTQGIIIKRSNFSETDRILNIYTKDFGRVSALAKGVRKSKSRLSGHLELFYLSDLVIYKGKNLDIVTSAEIIESYQNILLNKTSIQIAYFIAELVYCSTGEGMENKRIFELIRDCYQTLGDKKYKDNIFFFQLKLFSELGHYPEINKCVVCRKALKNENNYFNYLSGGVVCSRCRRENFLQIDADVIKILRMVQVNNLQYLSRLKMNDNHLNPLSKCIEEMRSGIVEKDLKTTRYLQGI
jgi:DNA repair protein RecO (recombination protein O)